MSEEEELLRKKRFEEILWEIVGADHSLVPGAYEAFAEHYKEDVLSEMRTRHPVLFFEPRRLRIGSFIFEEIEIGCFTIDSDQGVALHFNDSSTPGTVNATEVNQLFHDLHRGLDWLIQPYEDM